jgi:hypothetical protein
MRRLRWSTLLLVALLVVVSTQREARAGIIDGSLSLDTSGLSGTFEIAFILTDGSGTGDANNTILIDNVAFGGGSAGAVDPALTTSGASGSFASAVTITDSEFFNAFAQMFTAGTRMTFDFGLTTNVDAGGFPDQFSVALLQSDGTPIPSVDPSGAVLVVNIDSARPAFQSFATDVTPAPTVTIAATVPEPSTLLLLGLALTVRRCSARRRVGSWFVSM